MPKTVKGDGGGSRTEPNYTTTSGCDHKYIRRFRSGPEQLAGRNPFFNGRLRYRRKGKPLVVFTLGRLVASKFYLTKNACVRACK